MGGMKAGERRLDGAAGALPRIEELIRQADPQAGVRLDGRTGILHVATSLDTLEITAALARAGYDATAMTG